MNHHYRIVWSQVSNTWIAVSELSKGHGKSAATRKRVVSVLASLGLSALSMASSALDLPAGAQVTAGSATVQTPAKGAMLVNQSTQRAVIKWNDFSIGQGKQVNFAQPNASAATLNVVTGGNASAIAGTLKSNGSVYLINQNGIAITPTGLVDTRAGFIASTLRMDEAAFMGGKNVFSGKGASVVNQGQILTGPGGTVGLLGSTVANEGLISAPLGKVALGSGEAATLDLSGDGFLQLMLPASVVGADGQALVTNSGVIQADGGTVMLKAATVRQALREAVNMPGTISARSVSGQNGAIVLEAGLGGTVRVTGSLTADGESLGGRIDVTGANVVLEGAALSATGTERGGLVRVGGAFRGGREQPADSENAALFAGRFGSTPALATATTTSIDAASSINVSATGATGTGGTAIVWSDSTTVMQGAISARGAESGGAVEVSAKSTVQSVALKRIDLGQGGKLLIDPQDIVIDRDPLVPADAAGNYSYATPGASTHLSETDLTALLSAGTTVSLQASQDISWLDNFSFVTRTPTTPGGDLNLSAGRSVTLSGDFETGGGNWTIVANDTKAHGVVDAQRGTGDANINVRHANFINSNGNLSLTLADGAGNKNKEVGFIWLGKYTGNGLTAEINSTAMPDAVNRGIWLSKNIDVSGTISLTGNLQVVQENPVLTLSGQRVTWTNEKSGGTIEGYNAIKFIENGVTTRLGQLSGNDAVRLGLGDSPAVGVTRTYGDSDPSIADLLALTPQLHVAAHSAAAFSDPLGAILSANSLVVAGPGVLAAAGSNHMALSATNTLAFAEGLRSGYFVDLTPASLPLTINKRTVTPTVSAGSYIYGSPTAVASFAGVVNGDVLNPVATLNSTVGVTMAHNGTGFGFAETVAAGLSTFSLTGLSGDRASNYTLDLSGVTGSTLAITLKALGYVAGSGGQIYGSAGTMPSASLSGIVAGDDVAPVVALNAAGQTVSLVDRLPAGTYASDVASLSGNQAGNYVVAATGNTSGHYVVDPKPVSVTYNASPLLSTYGTQSTLEAPTLTGILTGDVVTGTFGASSSGAPFTLTPTTPAGTYSAVVTGLSGASSSNYVVTGGNTYGTLAISRKTLTYTGSDSSQVYGSLTLPSPTLNGLVGNDNVGAVQRITKPPTWYLAGASGAYAVGNYWVDLDYLTGTSAANYTFNTWGNTPNHVAITPKPVTFSVASASSTYGTNAVLPAANLSGIVSGDVVGAGPVIAIGNGTAALNASTAAGHYTLGIVELNGFGVANNYILANSGNTTGTLTIEPKALTWAVANGTGIYGNALTNATTLSGLVGGDSVASSIAAFDANGAILARPTVGTYGVGVTSLAGPLAGNYALAASGNTMGSVTIGPRPLTYTVAPTSSVYGTLAQDGTVTFGNVLPGDSVGVATMGYQVASTPVALTERSPVGNYTAQVNALTGANPNYVIASTGNTNGVLTIAPKPVTFSTPNASSTYGTAAVLETGTLSGVLAGDLVMPAATTLATAALPTDRSAAGSYALITPSLSGAQAGNYTIAATGSTSGVLDIAPKLLTYSLKVYWADQLLADTVTYGNVHPFNGHTGFETLRYGWGSVNGVTSFPGVVSTLSGVLAGDDVSLQVNSPSLPVSSSGAYTVGTYRWTGGALSSPNYVLAATGNTDKTLTILPRPLQVSPVGNSQDIYSRYRVEYGSTAGAVPAVNLNLDNTFDIHFSFPLRNVDQVTAAAQYVTSQGNVDRLAERQAVGQYRVVMKGGLTGSDAANYIVTSTSEIPLDVTPKTVNIQLPNATQVTYGQQVAITPSISGVLSGDALTATISVCNRDSRACASGNGTIAARTAAGSYTLQAVGIEGASAANYLFTAPQDGLHYSRASLRINSKLLGVTADPASLSLTYGDQITSPLVVTGVEAGDLVQVIPKALFITAYQTSNDIKNVSNTLLDAGSYRYYGVTAGRDMGNYQIPASFGTITVAKRPLVATLPDRSTTYGTFLQAQPSLSNVVAGQTVTGVVSTFDSTDQAVTYSERTSAGHFTNRVTALSGATAANYVIDSASMGGALDVLPKTLVWEPVAAPATVYGSAAKLGTLNGVLFNDDVGIQATSSAALGQMQLESDGSGGQFYGSQLDVGIFDFSVAMGQLSGSKSGNYRLPAGSATTGSLIVTPKPLTYSVSDGRRSYGNYFSCNTTYYCDAWGEPRALNLNSYFVYGNLARDKFVNDNFTLGLLNAKGEVVVMDSKTPVGEYQFVLAGLSGSVSKNYTIATTGNTPGRFTVTPLFITYSTSSAIYLQGTGLVGTLGIATLHGPNGTLLNGDQVQGVVSSNVDWANLHEGRYYFPVTSLTGRDAGNYTVTYSTSRSAYLSRDNSPWRDSDVGTLDVFSSNRFGQVFTTQITSPLPVVLPELTFTDFSISITKDAISLAQPSSQVDVSVSASPTAVASSGSSANLTSAATLGRTSVGASVSTSTGDQTSTDLGEADLTAKADASTSASAKAGPTGAKAQAEAGVETSVTVSIGSGTISTGAEANVSTEASLGKDGAKVTAKSTADVNVQGGGSGSAGPVGDISGKGTVGATAGAEATGTATIKDGKVSTGLDTSVGVGVSANAQVGVSGSTGSANASATVYSPGSFGGKAGVTGGYSDGKVSVALNLGAQLGFGGLNLNIDLSIDTGAVWDGMATAGEWIGDAIGYGDDRFSRPLPLKPDDFWNDPVTHFAFLQASPNWGNYYQDKGGYNYTKTLNFVYAYKEMTSLLADLVQREAARQNRLLELLRTDPKAAVDFAHSTDLNGSSIAGYEDLIRQADAMGVQLSMTNGKLGFVKK